MMMNSGKKIRGAVIGYGGAFNMGKHHAGQMASVGIEFAAACDLDAARMEQAAKDFPGIRTFTRIEDLVAQPDIDLVVVITPHNTHADIAMQVLDSGKHCILEKPFCVHADDADALIKKARAKEVMLSVYHNRRWDGWYLAFQDLNEKDMIGQIFNVELFFGGYGHPGTWWRSSKEISGGALYDWGAHYIDWLLGFMPGKIKSVRGHIQNLKWNDVSNEDHIDGFIEFDNGALVHIQYSSIAHAGKYNRRILGTKGAIVDASRDGSFQYYTELNGLKIETKVPYKRDNQIAYYHNIADHLMNGAELIVKPEQARRTIAVIETIEKSALAGRELPLPYEDE